jgi:SAM-dependent methyltransferase
VTTGLGAAAEGRTDAGRLLFTRIAVCRSCGAGDLEEVLDLGATPLADRLVSTGSFDEPDPIVPLTLVFCGSCGLLQIRETVDPEVLFGRDYPYYSSVSPALVEHFRANAEAILGRRNLDERSLVLELASNDGCQLRPYNERGIPVLGIDPAEGPARRAVAEGIDTRVAFFTEDYARRLAAEGIRADVVHANNVLAHVEDTNGFVAGIVRLLKEEGELVVECPYVRDLVDRCEFDTIYHQHLCYFSVTSVASLLERHGLYVNRVERVWIHGGSLRIFAGRVRQPDTSVGEIVRAERADGLDRLSYYGQFGARVDVLRASLRNLLDRLKNEGKRIAGYGAAAKACTLMSSARIGQQDLEYVVDLNPVKHGRYLPGTRLPILPVERVLSDMPDFLLILAWNFADEIMAQQAEYAAGGGRFIVPVPEPRVV